MSKDEPPEENGDTEGEEVDETEKASTVEELKKRAQERREKNLEQIEFNKCKQIRGAGQVFWETEFDTPEEAVPTVAEQLGINEEHARKLLQIYTLIFTQSEREVSSRASLTGIQYFTGTSIEELAEENDRSIDETCEDVRAYVGAHLSEHDQEEIDLDRELPATPPNPVVEAFQEMDIGPLVPDLPDLVEPIRVQNQLMAQQLAAALPDYSNVVSKMMAPVHESIQQEMQKFSEMMQETLEPFQELREQYEEIEKSDFEFKWLSDVNFGAFMDLYEVYKEEGNEAAAELLAEQLRDEDDIKDFKDYFASFDEYSERQPIIDEALDAHVQGRYALSIPALLSQLDGIFIDTALELGLYIEDDEPTGVEIVNTGEGSPQHIPEIREDYRRYYASVLWGRRVEILHGKDTDFSDNEILSAKLIWFFFQTLHTVENIRSAEHIGDYHITRVIHQQNGCDLETLTDELSYQKEYVENRIGALQQIGVVNQASESEYTITEDGVQYLEGDRDLDYDEVG